MTETGYAKSNKTVLIRFAIMTAVIIAVVGVCIGLDYVFFTSAWLSDRNIAAEWLFVAGALIGGYLQFLVVDTLASRHSLIMKILKFILFICAICLMIIATFFSLAMTYKSFVNSVWLYAFIGTAQLYSTITTLTYFWNRKVDKLPKIIIPCVPYISLFFGFILSLCFVLIGNVAGEFFYGWVGFILCLAAIAISIIVYVKKFKRVYKTSSSLRKHENNNVNVGEENVREKEIDKNHKKGQELMDERIFASAGSINFLPTYSELPIGVESAEWKSLGVSNKYTWFSGSSDIVKYIIVKGTIMCKVLDEYKACKQDLCERVKSDVKYSIECAVRDVVEELHEKYSNYQGEYKPQVIINIV